MLLKKDDWGDPTLPQVQMGSKEVAWWVERRVIWELETNGNNDSNGCIHVQFLCTSIFQFLNHEEASIKYKERRKGRERERERRKDTPKINKNPKGQSFT